MEVILGIIITVAGALNPFGICEISDVLAVISSVTWHDSVIPRFFKRIKGVFAGSVDTLNNNPHVKPYDFKVFKATHPLVSILVEGVCVNALIDTGSMRSFINDKVHAVFDFNNLQSSHVDNAHFVSITGDPLDISQV